MLQNFFQGSLGVKSTFSNTNSIAFVVASSQYINFGNNVADDYNTPLSWTFWINPTSVAGARTTISKIDSTNKGWLLFNDSTNVALFYSHGAANGLYVRGGTLITGSWQFISITLDGSGTAAGAAIYINGSLQTNIVLQNNLNSTITISGAMAMASNLAGPGNTAEEFFPGNMAQVAHWNAVLTGGNITTLYNGGTPVNPLTQSFSSSCDHYWPLGNPPDTIAASGIIDRVGSVDGTPINSPTISNSHP